MSWVHVTFAPTQLTQNPIVLILLLINILNLSWKSSLAIIKMNAIYTKIGKQTEETANYARMLDGT